MPFLLFLENLDATWAICKSHFIINSETGILRVFLTYDGVVSGKYLADEGSLKWSWFC